MLGVVMLIALVLAVLVFKLSSDMDWHWGVGIFLAAIPLAASYFLGIFGVIGSAMFVGAMFKAASAQP